MPELSWEYKTGCKSELIDKLRELTNALAIREIQEISSKIEILFQMGLVKDEEKIKELRQKIEELKQGTINASTNNGKSA